METQEQKAVLLLDQCIEKAASDYLADRPINTEGLHALADVINRVLMYNRYREDKDTLARLTTASQKTSALLSESLYGQDNHREGR